jgi:hypothetical protein
MSGARGAKRARATAAEKGKGFASGAPSRDDLRALVARLDRGALEALLVDAVADAAAPTLATLTEALPARLRAAAVARTRVADTTTLVETGPFRALSADETLAILALLPLKDKLTVLTCVCKGWRRLRALPEAWAALHVQSMKGWLSPKGLARLLEWAPAACAAKVVSLDASERGCGFSVDNVCRFVKALTAVRELRLKDKLSAKCFEAIRVNHGAQLCSLSLSLMLKDQKMFLSLLDLLRGCPALESLSLSRHMLGCQLMTNFASGDVSTLAGLTPDALRYLAAGIAAARGGGGSSLLRQLRAPVSAPGLGLLGTVFPELSSLDLPAMLVPAAAGRGLISNWPPQSAEEQAEGDAAVAAALPSSANVAPLLRLARLSVCFAGETYNNPSPTSVAHVLAALLPSAAPSRLRHLALKANVKSPSTVGCPLAHLQPGGAAALHALLLQAFHLGDDDEDGVEDDGALAQLRELRSLSLENCSGSAAVQQACAAVARCAQLRTLRLANMSLGAQSLAALPLGQLTCLTLERCGAGAPAALLAAARAGALSSLVTLSLLCPTLDPLNLDAAHGGGYHLIPHEASLTGMFAANAPLPALRSLTLYGADMADWPRLVAPALRSVTLVMGASTRSPVRGAAKRGAIEWEVQRAAVAAAVAKACPLAKVLLAEEAERSTHPLLDEEYEGDAF